MGMLLSYQIPEARVDWPLRGGGERKELRLWRIDARTVSYYAMRANLSIPSQYYQALLVSLNQSSICALMLNEFIKSVH